MATIDKIKQGNNTKKKPTGMASAVNSTEKIRTWQEHVIDSEDLARQLETLIHAEGDEKGYHGLTEHQASEFFKKYGPNALTEKKGLPWYLQFLLAMTGLFNYLLWAGAALCYISFGI